MSTLAPILAGIGAATVICSLVVLGWVIQYEVAERRQAKRDRKTLSVAAPPQDGRPLDDYEKAQLGLMEDGLKATPWWEAQ